jgi:hypothetical protein
VARSDAGVQVADVDGGVQSLVGEGVGHWSADTGAVFSVVSVGPLCAWVGNVLLGNQPTVFAGDFTTVDVQIPIHCAAFITRPCVSFKGASGWPFATESASLVALALAAGVLGFVLLFHLVNSWFSSS